jgi:cytochrome c oxidase assembly protein subunit 11
MNFLPRTLLCRGMRMPSSCTAAVRRRLLSTEPPPPPRRTPPPRSRQQQETLRKRNESLGLRMAALVVLTLGASYAFVPLYQIFCQATGYGGTVQTSSDASSTEAKLRDAAGKPKKRITIFFNSDVSPRLPWQFVPSQRSISCETGETVLAFYRATNLTDKAIVGISTYNVTPMKAGLYFHKIQCFCFDEQRLRPHETVEMPILFYVDPDIVTDKNTADIDNLVLSYSFFLVDQESGDPETGV